MSHRLASSVHHVASSWHAHHLTPPVAWTAGLSGAVGLLTGDSVAAAITVVGLAALFVLGRAIPVISEAITQWGRAYATYRGELHRQLEETRAEVVQNRSQIETLSGQASVARDVAAAAAAAAAGGAEDLRRENLELHGKLAALEKYDSQRRHDMADRFQTALLARDVEIDSLKKKLGLADVRDVRAINTVSGSVRVLARETRTELPEELPRLEPLPDPGPGPGDAP